MPSVSRLQARPTRCRVPAHLKSTVNWGNVAHSDYDTMCRGFRDSPKLTPTENNGRSRGLACRVTSYSRVRVMVLRRIISAAFLSFPILRTPCRAIRITLLKNLQRRYLQKKSFVYTSSFSAVSRRCCLLMCQFLSSSAKRQLTEHDKTLYQRICE